MKILQSTPLLVLLTLGSQAEMDVVTNIEEIDRTESMLYSVFLRNN